jgi:hypothetical protein
MDIFKISKLTNDKEYVCTLPKKYLKLADIELGETKTRRTQALQQLFEWFRTHPHIQKYRIDTIFFVAVLRRSKFNVAKACVNIENYLIDRQSFPDYFLNLDTENCTLNALIDTGYAFFCPERDELGRRIIVVCPFKFDTERFGFSDLIRLFIIIFHQLMLEEISQVNGIILFIDGSEMSLKYANLFTLSNFKTLSRFARNSPHRLKQVYFYNFPGFAKVLGEIAIKLSSSKIRNRYHFIESIDEINVDPKILPCEYGGDVKAAKMVDDFKKILHKNRQKFLDLDNLQTNFPLDYRSSNKMTNEISGSFRKLEID